MDFKAYEKKQSEQIIKLFEHTFSDSEGQEEGTLIGNLAKNILSSTPENDLYVFVAEKDGQVAGSILFTRLTFDSDKTAFLLAPVAVSTNNQGQGIGQKLIRYGLETMRDQGVSLAFTYGDPDFYTRLGFEQITEAQFKAPMPLSLPHGWMAQSLTTEALEPISGKSYCVPAFNDPALW